MPHIREVYERLTRMQVNDRQPYAGNLVFSAFSGSHPGCDRQRYGVERREEANTWTVPYLPIDPSGCWQNVRFRCYPYQQPDPVRVESVTY